MEQKKVNYKQFLIISVIAFVFYLSNQMVATTISKYADSMNATSQFIGLISGMFGMMALFTRPFVGQMVDKENTRHLMFATTIILLLSNAILLVAVNPYFLLVARAFNGFGWGFGSTLCMTTACNALPKEKMTSGIGIYTLAQTLAQVLGPSMAAKLIEITSYMFLYSITTGLMILAFVLIFISGLSGVTPTQRHYSFSIKEMFAVNAWVPTLMTVCNSMVISSNTAFILLYADSLGIKNVSYFFTIQAIVILCCRPILSKIMSDKNITKAIVFCEIIVVIGLLNLYWADSFLNIMISAVLFGFGIAGAQPALMSLCVDAVGENERGKATNTSYVGSDIGNFSGSYLAGLVAGLLGYRYIYLSICLPVILGLLVFVKKYFLTKSTLRVKEVETNEINCKSR